MRRTGRPKRTNWPECKVEGCSKSIEGSAKGMCAAHYMAARRGRIDSATGEELRPKKRVRSYGPGALCLVPECGRRPKGRGLCTLHYQQWKQGVSWPGVEIPDRGHEKEAASYSQEACLVEGCDQRPMNRWMCSKHAQQREAGIIDEDGRQLREPMPRGRRPLDFRKEAAGYILVRAPKGHPYARHDGSILEHRLVMERRIGKYLDPDEFIVHHKDGDRANNSPDNLEVQPYKTHGPGKDADVDVCRRLMMALKYNDPESYYRLLEGLN
jgi:hypothetical protein